MMSDTRTRNRTLVILFCLISLLTALDPARSVEVSGPTSSTPQTSSFDRERVDVGAISWMRSGLITGDSEDSFSARLRPDLQDATASDLLIGADSELLKRTAADTAPTEFDFHLPNATPVLMAHVNGMPGGSGGLAAPPGGLPVLGAPPESGCTPEQNANPHSSCFKGETPKTPQAVPEPSTVLLLGAGLAVIAAASRFRPS
jgi:hypothetical protein